MTKERKQGQKSGPMWSEWRLYANFLHRELARLWYGKESVFKSARDFGNDDENPSFWGIFSFFFGSILGAFGEAHGIALDEMIRRHISAIVQSDKFVVVYSSRLQGYSWLAHWVLGDALAREFLFDAQIIEIFALSEGAYAQLAEGKMPPYAGSANLKPLEFYESLPVAPRFEEHFYGKNPSPKS